MPQSYFAPFPPDLPVAEVIARRKRQRHAQWGVTVATLGGSPASPAVVKALQGYIDGILPIEELAQVEAVGSALPAPAFLATLTRHRLAEGEETSCSQVAQPIQPIMK